MLQQIFAASCCILQYQDLGGPKRALEFFMAAKVDAALVPTNQTDPSTKSKALKCIN